MRVAVEAQLSRRPRRDDRARLGQTALNVVRIMERRPFGNLGGLEHETVGAALAAIFAAGLATPANTSATSAHAPPAVSSPVRTTW